jgi:hypothetical protein
LPGRVELNGKFDFVPQTATIDPKSVTLGLKVDELAVGVDLLNDILRVIVPAKSTTKQNVVKTNVAAPVTFVSVPPASLSSNPKSLDVVSETVVVSSGDPPTKRSRSSTIFSARFLPSSPAVSLRSLEGRLLSPRASATPFFRAFSVSVPFSIK